MSDYVENQEYSMQLAALRDVSFAYDWARLQDRAASSLFGDITTASLQEDIDVDNNEWSRTNDALENGPWRDIFDWKFDGQDSRAQSGDRPAGMHLQGLHPLVILDRTVLMPYDNTSHSGTSADVDQGLVCDHPRCGSKVFKRKGDLTRHKKLHQQKRKFPCMAQECSFSFTRNDKLMDHIRAEHEAEELFACLSCSMLLTRDVLSLHQHMGEYNLTGYDSLSRYRQCSLPKCNFRTQTSSCALDKLQDHLLKDHDPKGRKMYASLLASRGYDHESANIVCPICTEGTALNEHKEFGFHFLEMHCPNLSAVNPNPRYGQEINSAMEAGYSRLWSWGWERQKWGVITDEQRKHRRTILSLLPMFGTYPVWEDIKKCW